MALADFGRIHEHNIEIFHFCYWKDFWDIWWFDVLFMAMEPEYWYLCLLHELKCQIMAKDLQNYDINVSICKLNI